MTAARDSAAKERAGRTDSVAEERKRRQEAELELQRKLEAKTQECDRALRELQSRRRVDRAAGANLLQPRASERFAEEIRCKRTFRGPFGMPALSGVITHTLKGNPRQNPDPTNLQSPCSGGCLLPLASA